MPALRDRREDITLFVEHFRGVVNERAGLGLDIRGVDRDTMAILKADEWPGNVRELKAVVKRAMVRRRVGSVTPEDIVLPGSAAIGLRGRCGAGIKLTAA